MQYFLIGQDDQIYQDAQDGQEMNQCMINNGGCEGFCINTIGGYHCTCGIGLTLKSITTVTCDGKHIKNINKAQWLSILCVFKYNASLLGVAFSYKCGGAIVDNSTCVACVY